MAVVLVQREVAFGGGSTVFSFAEHNQILEVLISVI